MGESISAWLLAIAASIVTGAAALLSAYLTNKANNERFRLQLNREEEYRAKEFLRNRGEELYENSEKWLNGMFYNFMNMANVMKGKITFDEYLDQIIDHAEKNKSNAHRIELIVRCYLPELISPYEIVIEAREMANDIESQFRIDYNNGKDSGRELYNHYHEAHQRLIEVGDAFKTSVIESISIHNKALHRTSAERGVQFIRKP